MTNYGNALDIKSTTLTLKGKKHLDWNGEEKKKRNIILDINYAGVMIWY